MMIRADILSIIFFGISLFSCVSKQVQLFKLIESNYSGIVFSNTIIENDSIHYFNFPYIYNGGGVAVVDVNNDGLQDLFFSGNMVSCKLYLNKGQLQFEDISEQAGINTTVWAMGVSIADINQDGWQDIYVSVGGSGSAEERKNLLYINQGDLSFEESAEAYGIADDGHCTQAGFFDYDRDGDLDLYIMRHSNESYAAISKLHTITDGSGPSTDRLYKNMGINTSGHPYFEDVSNEAHILIEGYGLGLALADLNGDGWPDIYIANDFIANDLLYINNQDGTFSNQLTEFVTHTSQNGMGNSIADINNDGLPDIVVMDMLPPNNARQKTMTSSMNYQYFKKTLASGFSPQFIRNTLQLNRGLSPQGKPVFSEVGRFTGLHETDWSWSPLIADFDNDGFCDIHITNGFRRDVTDHDFQEYSSQVNAFEQGSGKLSIPNVVQRLFQLDSVYLPNYLFQNNGDLNFDNRTQEWGMNQPSMSNGSAFADLDNDGDLDLVINNINAPAFLYENRSTIQNDNHFVRLKFKGPPQNQDGLGVVVKVNQINGTVRRFENFPVRGYLSTSESRIHIGLGKDLLVDTLEVLWPDGNKNLYFGLQADTIYEIEYTLTEQVNDIATVEEGIFKDVSKELGIEHRHLENDHSDFTLEPLLMQLYDYNGPGIAVGDINGDGLIDFYIGGARFQTGTFFIQQKGGTFTGKSLPDSEMFEDMGALLFDADKDGDLDLYVVSGGSSVKYFDKGHYQDRLYLNDGSGIFTWSKTAIPDIQASGSCVVAADFDGDRDLDLFVGGRILPGRFPETPRSYLLENQGGVFVDVTVEKAPGLANVGMVCSALWSDFDQDYDLDLLLVGEWMPISIFQNTKGVLKDVTRESGLSAYSGWWNSIIGADMDHDGDIDYIVGNRGENTAFKTSSIEPLRVYWGDFDNNSYGDAIITRFINGREYPIAPRGVLVDQLELVKRAFPQYSQFARADISQILTSFDTAGMRVLEINYLKSSYVENRGDGSFVLHPLPKEAQLAPLFGLEIGDYNADGNLDLLGVGNFSATEVISGWYDAGKGLTLLGDGQGAFKALPIAASGFYVDGDGRALSTLPMAGAPLHIATVNSDSLRVFERKIGINSKIINIHPDEIWADLHMEDGRVTRREFYRGQGYLSQAAPLLVIPQSVISLKIYDQYGRVRTIAN